MSEIIGVVTKVSEKVLPSGTYFSFVLDGDNQWYRTGRDKPKFMAGHKVKFQSKTDQYGTHCDLKTLEFKEGEAAPASSTAGAKAGAPKSDYQQRQAYWEDKEVRDIENQKRISYQAATNTAIALVNAALSNEAIVLPASKAKGKRFEVLQEIISNEADRIYAIYAAAPDRHDSITSTVNLETTYTDAEEAVVPAEEHTEQPKENEEW